MPLAPRRIGISAMQVELLQLAGLFVQPVEPSRGLQRIPQVEIQRHEVAHVVFGVLQLFRRERTTRPVGARVSLRERVSEPFRH